LDGILDGDKVFGFNVGVLVESTVGSVGLNDGRNEGTFVGFFEGILERAIVD
jgi:hypothetical protein